MNSITGGEIIPGKSIGSFHLGASWTSLKKDIDKFKYEKEQISGGFKILTNSLWFFFDEKELLVQITALNKFSGKLKNIIRIGSQMKSLTAVLGDWTTDEDGNFIVPSVDGICFNPHHSINPDLKTQAPNTIIDFISIYND